MSLLTDLFGQGKDLTILQMSLRGVIVFFIALALIRFSGRRSFGLHMPLDNIITITLGAVLSRAIVGASGFMPVLATCATIVILHRFLAWLVVHHPAISKMVAGEKMLLFSDGKFLPDKMNKALVCKEDILQGIRQSALTEEVGKIAEAYIERNGEISVIRKSS